MPFLRNFDLFSIFALALVLFTSMPVHEFAHAYVADKLGDPTARYQGRLDLNPFHHIDPVGALCLLLVGFGWAKPVPVNPYNFKNPKRDMALTALAGPVSNLLLATVILLIYKLLLGFFGYSLSGAGSVIITILSVMISTNISLAVFNLIPIGPLDGMKILGLVLPDRIYYKIMQYERQLYLALLVLLVFNVLDAPIHFLASYLLRGMDFITGFVDLLFRYL